MNADALQPPNDSQSDIDQHIKQLIQKFDNHKRLFLRDERLYDLPLDESRLNDIKKQLCMWLGIKPRDFILTVSEQKTPAYQYLRHQGIHELVISQHILNHTHFSVSLVARGCCEYYLHKHQAHPVLARPQTARAVIDEATIDLGFGVIILNGLIEATPRARSSKQSKPVPPFNSSLHQYCGLFIDYTKDSALSPRLYVRHLLPRARRLVSDYVSLDK